MKKNYHAKSNGSTVPQVKMDAFIQNGGLVYVLPLALQALELVASLATKAIDNDYDIKLKVFAFDLTLTKNR